MKKGLKYLFLGLFLFVGLGLVACDNNSSSGSGSGTQQGSGTGEGQGSQTGTGEGQGGQTGTGEGEKTTYKEVADCNVASGKYMLNDVIYDYNKNDKKVIATQYESYTAYKNNVGTKQFEATVKFVEKSNTSAVYFENGGYEYFFLVKEEKVRIIRTKNSVSSEYVLQTFDNIVEPAYGTYVSAKYDQYVVDASGNRIPKDDGGYQKEDFYLFLELTATSAKVYNSDNNQTHGATPLYSLDNYVLYLKNGHVTFSIKHPNGEYTCSFTVKSDTIISCTNYSEDVKGGDYGMSGNLTKIA